MTRIALGSDHAGFLLKNVLREHLKTRGFDVLDLGTFSEAPVDYPDIAALIGRAIQDGRAPSGILVCGSGVGAAIAASKLRGIRASVCHDTYSARQGVEHDNMNVLTLGARIVGTELAKALVDAFTKAEFSHEERHVKRVAKIAALEVQACADARVEAATDPQPK